MAETRNHTGHLCGANHPKARLTTEQVKEMREIYTSGSIGYPFLAEIFNCGISTARDIVLYRTRWNG